MPIDPAAFDAWADTNGEIPFDIYAQDPAAWPELTARIPDMLLSSAGGGGFLFQAEGLLAGLPFYFRHKNSSLDLYVGEADGSAFNNRLYQASGKYHAELDQDTFISTLADLVTRLERAPYLWRFMARILVFNNDPSHTYTVTDDWETVAGWGHTAAEAYIAVTTPQPFLIEHGWSEAYQRQMWLDREVNPRPVNTDNRVFPNPEPPFTVLPA